MRKLTIVLAAILFMVAGAQAQHVFDKGDKALNLGLGLLGVDGFIPSIEASFEVGMFPTGDVGLISLGAEAGYKYSTYSYTFLNDYNYNYHQFQLGARAAWHLQTFESDKYDVYAGIGLGFRSYTTWESYDYVADEPVYGTNFGLYESVFVGGRMMMGDNLALFAEVGYSSLSAARIGLTFFM
jgi:hypothetical protein